MDITSWFQITAVCFLGAISPGPSLALIIGNTITGGRIYGVATSLGHAIGIGCWAFLTAVGVAEVIVGKTSISLVLQFSGACLLAYIGFRTITTSNRLPVQQISPQSNHSQTIFRGFGEGFLISLLNPKIAIFFLAIFSHIINTHASWTEPVLIGITAAVIDASWYVTVAVVLTGTGLIGIREIIIRRVSGIILILVALYLLGVMLRGLLYT